MPNILVSQSHLFEDFNAWTSELATQVPRHRIVQISDSLFRRYELPWESTSLPLELRRQLQASLRTSLDSVAEYHADQGMTTKAVLAMDDGAKIETVLMRYPKRSTVCISSQVGCAMGCTFCATGQGGFGRHLRSSEMEEQWVWASRALRSQGGGDRPTNVVMMGMGEPLANYDQVILFVRALVERYGLGQRSITISTVGIVPGIRRLTNEPLQVNLAVSIHAPDDETRNQIVPMNHRYGIDDIMDALNDYVIRTHRRVSFEYALINGVNDHPEHAARLAALARELRAHVNLIPLNPTPGYPVQGTPLEVVRRFRDALIEHGVAASIRTTRGDDIAGACGQLVQTIERRDRPKSRPSTTSVDSQASA
ncbi:MAG: 23S rRNA (adenine(2503)-C(2))-methyltransferase RlmN [Acidimicrobiales bacterium]